MDTEDYSAYVSARWGALVHSAVLLGCSPDEAEDVAQTTPIRCHHSWDRVRRASNPAAYVYCVMVNVWAKSRRRRWWGERPTAELPDAVGSDLTDAALTSHTVRLALRRLSDDHRSVLVLRFFADLSEREVAAALGIPTGTVKSRISRALAQLGQDADLTDLRSQETP